MPTSNIVSDHLIFANWFFFEEHLLRTAPYDNSSRLLSFFQIKPVMIINRIVPPATFLDARCPFEMPCSND